MGTALLYASEYGHLHIVKWLLETREGVDIDAGNSVSFPCCSGYFILLESDIIIIIIILLQIEGSDTSLCSRDI